MADQILTARKGPVLEITLNRPEIGNAASDAMAVELAKLLLGARESAEIVVLRGAGDDFCVGRETTRKRPPARAREAGIVSEVFPAAELDAAVEALCEQIMRAPRPARVGCKDYARTALDMDTTGAIDYARSIHAVINSSSEMLPKGHK